MAENALEARYDTAYGEITLTSQTVKQYLVRGNANVTDQELMLFINLCKFQRLNPFTNEVYLIKYDKDRPASTVIGRDAYLRRAYENPDYLGYESGITVERGDRITQKPGTCVYPGEEVIGGWCRVKRLINGREVATFKEVALSDYNKGQSIWKTNQGTMIAKVAESQALRAAFPTDYAGLYTPEEFGGQSGEGTDGKGQFMFPMNNDSVTSADENPIITKEQRHMMYKAAADAIGDGSNEYVITYIKDMGYDASNNMTLSDWEKVMAAIATYQPSDDTKDLPEPTGIGSEAS
jgi:phage recombination protein Bet